MKREHARPGFAEDPVEHHRVGVNIEIQQELYFFDPVERATESTVARTEGARMDLGRHLKELQRLVGALKKLHATKKPLSDDHLAEALAEAIAAARLLNLSELLATLEQQARDVAGRIDSAVEHRRENLLKSARARDMPHKRFGDFDRVGPFKVSYKGKKTRLELGSELALEFEEVDGVKVFERIQQQLEALEKEPLARDELFRTIRDALRIARDRGKDRDGWVPVRSLYVYVALLRNLQFDDFVKRPTARSFREYSTAQFVYDLARFGRRDWSCGDETLRAETPNMATVSAGKAMTLPSLEEVGKLGLQFARVRVEKAGTGGTERNPSKAR